MQWHPNAITAAQRHRQRSGTNKSAAITAADSTGERSRNDLLLQIALSVVEPLGGVVLISGFADGAYRFEVIDE